MEKRINIKKTIGFVTFLFFTAYALFLLSSCSIENRINRHNKQAGRHSGKAISLGYKPQADTLFKEIPIITKQARVDTVLRVKAGDTVVIEKERLQIKYVRFADSVFIEAECQADTVVKRVPYSVQEKIYVKQSFFDYLGLNAWWKQALFWLALVLIGVLFLWRLIK